MSELIRLRIAITSEEQKLIYFAISDAITSYKCKKVIAFSFEKFSKPSNENSHKQQSRLFSKHPSSLDYHSINFMEADIYTESAQETKIIIVDAAKSMMDYLGIPLSDIANFLFVYETSQLHKARNTT